MITALNHKEPDKVPIDFGGTLATIITRDANTALRSYLGLPQEDPEVAEIMCNTVRVSEDILQLYKVDTRPVYISDPTAAVLNLSRPILSKMRTESPGRRPVLIMMQ